MCVSQQNSTMKILLLLALIMAFDMLTAYGAWWNFGFMINKVIGKNAVNHYGMYGCYCGYKGKGSPKDATDRCCFEQECCYNQLKENGCETVRLNYKADYRGNKVTCVEQDLCEKQLCECDRKTVLCFKNNIHSYNKMFQFYKRRNCSGKAPQC